MTEPPKPYGMTRRGVSQTDVSQAADALLRLGERPTIDKVREKLGSGSPNTINPLLDVWWKNLSGRLDSGPAALHRLPESVAHVAEALWMQALEEGRRRADLELKSTRTAAADQQQSLEVRSHVLSLREGELDSRFRDRERTITDLNLQLRELTLMLRKEQATRDSLAKRLGELEHQLLARRRPKPELLGAPPRLKRKSGARRAAKPQRPPTRQASKKSAAKKRR